jgi:hypothetical protein
MFNPGKVKSFISRAFRLVNGQLLFFKQFVKLTLLNKDFQKNLVKRGDLWLESFFPQDEP